ncbi:MAG: hypothetical protein J5786_05395 [Clostridiales bacterium]|nr:hypothetical protein [Clostridiales bacterium]
MENVKMNEHIAHLDLLRKDVSETQKKGLPFIMASVVIWAVILLAQFSGKNIETINLYSFMSSSLLMPLSFMFSKAVKADIFRKSDNPVSKLGFLCTVNQMLYLVIVMWAFSARPDAMLMLYAIVFGAHLLPFGWVYKNKSYMLIAIIETLGALLTNIHWGNAATCIFMVIMEIILCIFLVSDIRKGRR